MVEGSLTILKNKWRQLREMMARNPEILSLFFALVLSGIVSHLDNTGGSRTPYVAPVPTRIFPDDSPVVDFPRGDMTGVRNEIESTGAEVWIIMYYAQWDANSLEAKKEFEKAAYQLSNQVLFMAVNCWYPYGACRSKVVVPYFPILFAHRDSKDGVQYTGLQRAPEIVQFLRWVCSPVKLIPDADSLMRLRAQHDTVALAYFSYDGTHAPQGLASFQWSALFHLEKDPIQPIPFAFVTGKQLATTLGLTHSKNLTLLRNFNVSMFYPSTEIFKARPILNWVSTHRESMVQWIAPPSLKSTILSSHVYHYPALILFTPHQHQDIFSSQFTMLREIVLQYYNCDSHNNNSYTARLINLIREERNRVAEFVRETNSKCNPEESEAGDDERLNEQDCCQTLAQDRVIESMVRPRGNVCQICETFSHRLQLPQDPCLFATTQEAGSLGLLEVGGSVTAASNACLRVNNFYSPFSHYQLCCRDVDRHCTCKPCRDHSPLHHHHHHPALSRQSVFAGEPSPPCATRTFQSYPQCGGSCGCSGNGASLSLGRIHDTHRCQTELHNSDSTNCRKESSRRTSETKQEEEEEGMDEYLDSIVTGLGCRTNRTIRFRAMRSEYFWSFADRLGIRPSLDQRKESSTGLAIVDIQSETHHVVQVDDVHLLQRLTKQLIINFTLSLLPREVRSHAPPNTPPTSHSRCHSAEDTICVTEVTTDTFSELVLNNNKDVLLLYYAPWCGACLRIHHVFLQLASLYRSDHRVLIARINADLNDLSWHLVTPAFPTIIFYSATRKADSVRFPEERAITLPNLLAFMLQQSH